MSVFPALVSPLIIIALISEGTKRQSANDILVSDTRHLLILCKCLVILDYNFRFVIRSAKVLNLFLFKQEKTNVLESLKTRAKMVYEILNTIEGVTCNEVMGAMYAFPRIDLPQKAIEKAEVYYLSLFIVMGMK